MDLRFGAQLRAIEAGCRGQAEVLSDARVDEMQAMRLGVVVRWFTSGEAKVSVGLGPQESETPQMVKFATKPGVSQEWPDISGAPTLSGLPTTMVNCCNAETGCSITGSSGS